MTTGAEGVSGMLFVEQNPHVDYRALEAAVAEELRRKPGEPPPPAPLELAAPEAVRPPDNALVNWIGVQLYRWPAVYRFARRVWLWALSLLPAIQKRPALFFALRWVRWLGSLPVLADQIAAVREQALRQTQAQLDAARAAEQLRARQAAEIEQLHEALLHWSTRQAHVQEAVAALRTEFDTLRTSNLEKAGQAQSAPQAAPQPAGPLSATMDGFYQDFEDAWRGQQAEVRERVSHYLPLVREAGAGRPEAPLADLGCGRGEWLAVLNDAELVALGVDNNRTAVERCRAQGLTAVEADVGAWLSGRETASLGGISALHVVEHVPFEMLVHLLDEALRVLQPGGILILETPDPANLLVGCQTFWLDPSHMRPIPADLLAFTVRARGFAEVRVERLHPADQALHFAPGHEVSDRLNLLLYGPQDYAVIARKPA